MPAVGKIWGSFRGDSRLLPLCSGTVMRRGIVVTAGHCLVDTDRVDANGRYPFLTRIVFVPGQTWSNPQSVAVDDIKAPWGVWEAVGWWVPGSFQNRTSALDWGLIQIAPRVSDGAYIGDVVGSWPIQTDIKFNDKARIYSVGYPGMGHWRTTRGYVGRGQYVCDTTWAAGAWLNKSGGYELWIRCPMNGGTSGGPWFVKLPSGWFIGGVNNWCNDDIKQDDESVENYCTPISTELRSLVFDFRFTQFWNAVLPQLRG